LTKHKITEAHTHNIKINNDFKNKWNNVDISTLDTLYIYIYTIPTKMKKMYHFNRIKQYNKTTK